MSYEITDQIGCNTSGNYFYDEGSGVVDFAEGLDLYLIGNFVMCSGCTNHAYSILNINGAIIEEGNFQNEFITLNHLADGLYFIRVNNFVLKFVK